MPQKEKDLIIKLKDADENLEGVRDQLRPYNLASWGMHWNGAPKDIEYLETDRYKIVAAK